MDQEDQGKRGGAGGFSTPFLGRILLETGSGPMAGAGNGVGDPAPSAPASTPEPSAPASPSPQLALTGERPSFNPNSDPAPSGASPGGSVVDANQPAGAGTAQQSGWTSIRDAARTFGYTPGEEFQDDAAFLGHLISTAQRSQQSDVYARLGQQLAPHAAEIQGYLQQRQQQPTQPQRNPWEPPEFDERWAGLVERDPGTGIFIAKPGVPPVIAQRVNEYADWQAQFQRNPAAMINQAAEARAREIAESTFNDRYAQVQREQTVREILVANQSWLYSTDAAGQIVRRPDGQPALSPIGSRYAGHVRSLQQAGVTDPRMQDRLAQQILRGELAAAQGQQAQLQIGQANPQTQQAHARPNQNPLGSLPPTERQVAPGAQGSEPSQAGTDLRTAMARAFAAEGITDSDFAPPSA